MRRKAKAKTKNELEARYLIIDSDDDVVEKDMTAEDVENWFENKTDELSDDDSLDKEEVESSLENYEVFKAKSVYITFTLTSKVELSGLEIK